jgi:hypothetical protein
MTTERKMILDREHKWRIKSRAIWLQVGDENTKLFHQFSKNRKTINKIWALNRSNGTQATSFVELVKEGVSHFNNLFKEDSRATIDVILQVASHSLSFIDHDGKSQLMTKVILEEL